MADRVRITDVSARDGLQNERGFAPTASKLRLVEALLASGVDEVEATSFVSPRWVPQLADAEEVMRAALGARARLGVEGVEVSCLVPNARGFERAAAFHTDDTPVKVSVFTAASETFSRKNTNATIAETLERFGEFLPRAFEMGMRVRMYVSCVVACPYEGEIAPGSVREVVEQLRGIVPAGYDAEIDLGETIGVATPAQIEALLGEFGEAERRALTLHLHDTRGRAAECVRAALAMGVRSFDGSAGGLGGCPYASKDGERAPGNISTALLVETVEGAGYATGIDRARLEVAGERALACVRDAQMGDEA